MDLKRLKNEQAHKKTARHFNIYNLEETFQVKVIYQNLNFKRTFFTLVYNISKSDQNVSQPVEIFLSACNSDFTVDAAKEN